jgi:anti-anti-sigma factor
MGTRWIGVRISGEFDIDCETAAAELVAGALEENPLVGAMMLDLSGCTFFSSSGIRFLAGVYAQCLLGSIALELRSSPSVDRVLALTDTDTMLSAFPPVALAA